MKKYFLGAFLALALVALIFLAKEGYRAYQLNQATAIYLFSETEVKGKDGKPLSRAELLDMVLRGAIDKAK